MSRQASTRTRVLPPPGARQELLERELALGVAPLDEDVARAKLVAADVGVAVGAGRSRHREALPGPERREVRVVPDLHVGDGERPLLARAERVTARGPP